jgi:hypothetical protein
VSAIKLPPLPDRTPVKVSVSMLPDLHQALQDYAASYAAAYGKEASIGDLIPAIVANYLESDRAFLQSRKRQ